MQHSKTTKRNDAVTKRQFESFLPLSNSLCSRFISLTFLLKTYYEVEYQISTSVVNYIVIPFINKKVKSNQLGLLTLVIAHLEMKISLHFCLFLYCFTFDILSLVKFLSTYCRFMLESSKNVQLLK